jgi:uncharacterized membrane protein
MDALRELLGPWYPYLKAVHVLAAALWSFSTAVAWVYYLKPALRAASERPGDAAARARQDEFLRRFDRGAAVEHVAFAVLVVTAVLLFWVGGFDLTRWSYVTALVAVGVTIILPMEAVDIYLSHMGGSLARLRADAEPARIARLTAHHRLFLRVTEPIVMLLVPALFVIAIAKPF